MSFKSPELLLSLLALPPLVWVFVRGERGRASRAAAWANPALLPNMVTPVSSRLRLLPFCLFLAALTLLLVGFARPQARFTDTKEGATVVFVLDVSGSMGSDDVKPTRLRAADAAITEFARSLPKRYRAALLTYASHTSLRVAPTYDRDELIRALPKAAELDGTATGDALVQAVTLARKAVGPPIPGEPSPAAVVLVSDGLSNAGIATDKAVAEARKNVVPITTIAIGTSHGSVTQQLTIGKDKELTPVIRQVPVELDALRAIAKGSRGRFFGAPSPAALDRIVGALGSLLIHRQESRELTVGFTAAAIGLMIAGAILGGLWFRRLV